MQVLSGINPENTWELPLKHCVKDSIHAAAGPRGKGIHYMKICCEGKAFASCLFGSSVYNLQGPVAQMKTGCCVKYLFPFVTQSSQLSWWTGRIWRCDEQLRSRPQRYHNLAQEQLMVCQRAAPVPVPAFCSTSYCSSSAAHSIHYWQINTLVWRFRSN